MDKPAFPGKNLTHVGVDGEGYYQHEPGMTLRQWYAGMALLGLVNAKSSAIVHAMVEDTDYTAAQATASIAFDMADAMIANDSV